MRTTKGAALSAELFCGCPMWANASWKGNLFPADAKSDEYLYYYSRVFNTVEGNTSFYADPSPEQVQKWQEQTPDNFRFTFKFPQRFTHHQQLNVLDDELNAWLNLFAPLADKIGQLMIQLPSQFSPYSLSLLDKFLQRLPQDFDYAVEIRHLNFFDKANNEIALNRLLMQHNANRVLFDSRGLFAAPTTNDAIADAKRKKPRLPVHAIATAKAPIVRYIGHPEFDKNPEFYAPWLNKLNQWQKEGMAPYFFFHTADNLLSPLMARQFAGRFPGKMPPQVLDSWEGEKQQSLF